MQTTSVLLALCGAWTQTAHAKADVVVAVLYFDNNTGDNDYDVLQKGLADMLVTDLAQVDALQVVEREKLEQVLGELNRQRSRHFDPKTAQKLGKLVGARYAVTGSFAALSPRMRIDIRLVEVATARVVMADKVIGRKDKFFDLQQQLVRKFVGGLNVRGVKPKASRVDDVDVLLKYSLGIDKADRGDLKGASKQLAQVVRAAPKFALAKRKYADILRRLKLANKRRDRALSDTEAVLLRNIEAALAVELAKIDDKRAAHRYLGYRIARGQHLLWKVKQLAPKPPLGQRTAWTPKKDRRASKKLMVAYFANSETLIRELEQFRQIAKSKRWRIDTKIDRDDERRGKELGISDDLGEWSFATPSRVAREVGHWALLGDGPFWGGVRLKVRPALVEVDKSYVARTIKLLEFARADLKANADHDRIVREIAEIIDSHAEGLVRLGRMEEAITVWQEYLDDYPKGKDFDAFEAKIESLLGVTDKAQAFQASLPGCRGDLSAAAYEEVARLRRAEGSAGVDRMVEAVIKACSSDQTKLGIPIGTLHFAAMDAVENGECGRFKKLLARARKVAPNPMFTDNIAKIGARCP